MIQYNLNAAFDDFSGGDKDSAVCFSIRYFLWAGTSYTAHPNLNYSVNLRHL